MASTATTTSYVSSTFRQFHSSLSSPSPSPSPRLRTSCRILGSFFTSLSSEAMQAPANAASSSSSSSSSSAASSKGGAQAVGVDAATAEEYALQSKLLMEFTNVPSVDKAWIFKSEAENTSRAMISLGQPNLLANKRRTMILSSQISGDGKSAVEFQWSPFPVEMTGVAAVVPSPSGSKLLVVRNKDGDSPTRLEIWCQAMVEKEIHIPLSVHGSVYTDGWFEGISWNHDESLIAYVAEEAPEAKPGFDNQGFKNEGSSEKECGSWKGQGDWEEDWGETYSRKRKPSLFVVDVNSGKVRPVDGIPQSLSVGQVVWAPSSSVESDSSLVFVGWSSENGPQGSPRKLGIKYCYNRPCALYAVDSPFKELKHAHVPNKDEMDNHAAALILTHGLSSAFFPRFSQDGKSLVFLSAKAAVESGAHSATNSLHRINWPTDGKLHQSMDIIDVIPVVTCPEDGGFPGLYCSSFLSNPWLSDGCTMVLSSVWYSMHVILLVNIFSCKVSRISPNDSTYSWNALELDKDNILAVCSSPIDPPEIKYGYYSCQTDHSMMWNWLNVSSPISKCSDKVRSLLSELEFSVLKIPVGNSSENLSEGARKPFESILVSHLSSNDGESCKQRSPSNPLIIILHGGPHSVSLTSYSTSLAFLSSLGFDLLVVNYRGSLGFGEEALQSLPSRIGSQDVNDVIAALDYVTNKGLANGSKVVVLGGSHGGFLTTHLVGQAPDRFLAAAARNPVCNLSLMVGTTDIPDWCYAETYGKEGKEYFSEAPTIENLSLFYEKSPIAHLTKVKTPILFLLGAQDLRVPVSNGLQYARSLREKGVKVKVIVFPEDVHGIERPQSDYESFINIGVWFKQHCN